MERIRDGLAAIVERSQPATVRQVFYQAVSTGLVNKTEAEYNGTVVRLLTELRRENVIPYGWIADNTRWMRKPRTWSSLDEALMTTARTYRRALWQSQPDYVEVWLEKDALAGVIVDETAEYDAPLMVTRGYPSINFLYEAIAAVESVDKPTFIYYLGDHDPSGVDIPRVIERTFRERAPYIGLTFEFLAVTEEQIAQWSLPTRPTKQTDTRARNFTGESVEVDAIPPDELRALVREAITSHVDYDQLARLGAIEAEERETLTRFATRMRRQR